MNVFLQLLLAGICIGAVYGMAALGFVLVFKATGVFNMGHGDIMMVGAFIMLALSSQLGLNVYVALVLALIATALVGYVIQWLLLRPMTGQPLFAMVMVTIALIFILRGFTSLIWGAQTYAYREIVPVGSLKVGGVFVSPDYTASLAISLVALGLFVLYFRRTKTGLAMRGVAEDVQLAESLGIRVRNITGIAWALAGAMAAIGGITLGMMTSVNYQLDEVGMKVLPVVVLGGFESIPGAIVGGFIMGVVANIAGGYLETTLPAFKEVAPYVVMLLILLVWPYGLFGEKRVERI